MCNETRISPLAGGTASDSPGSVRRVGALIRIPIFSSALLCLTSIRTSFVVFSLAWSGISRRSASGRSLNRSGILLREPLWPIILLLEQWLPALRLVRALFSCPPQQELCKYRTGPSRARSDVSFRQLFEGPSGGRQDRRTLARLLSRERSAGRSLRAA